MKAELTTLISGRATTLIADRVGIAVIASELPDRDEHGCVLRSADGHPNESFAVHFKIGWRSSEAVFVPAKFAGPLLSQLGQSSDEGKLLFSTFAEAIVTQKVTITFRINGADANPADPATWPADWRRVEFALRRFVVQEELDETSLELLILDLVVPAFAMLAALIGVEEVDPIVGEVEGRPIQSLVTRYERKKVNRELCIRLKGCRCVVCGFDFGATYGPLGAGYIEIHHAVPVSTMGADYVLDVRKDLFPLCANCHAMAHREDPPVTIEKLKDIIAGSSSVTAKCSAC